MNSHNHHDRGFDVFVSTQWKRILLNISKSFEKTIDYGRSIHYLTQWQVLLLLRLVTTQSLTLQPVHQFLHGWQLFWVSQSNITLWDKRERGEEEEIREREKNVTLFKYSLIHHTSWVCANCRHISNILSSSNHLFHSSTYNCSNNLPKWSPGSWDLPRAQNSVALLCSHTTCTHRVSVHIFR